MTERRAIYQAYRYQADGDILKPLGAPFEHHTHRGPTPDTAGAAWPYPSPEVSELLARIHELEAALEEQANRAQRLILEAELRARVAERALERSRERVEELERICVAAALVMIAYGNSENWPPSMPMSYAETINLLRATSKEPDYAE